MSYQNPSNDENLRSPANIPLIHGPITAEEQERIDQEERRKAREEIEDAFKERQIKATEASNNLARKNIYLTCGTIVIAAVACGATWYQGSLNLKSWQTAQDTLKQMKTASEDSTRQFQVQLGHFDAGLGRTDVLAMHAGEQATAMQTAATASKQANLISSNNFRQDQRPYLFPASASPQKMEVGKQLYVNVSLINYGRSPALHVTGRGEVFHGKDAPQQAEAYFTALGNKLLSQSEQADVVIFPGVPVDDKHGEYTSLRTKDSITGESGDFIINNDFAVVVAGRIQYTDVFGAIYYSDFCYSHFANGATPHCPKHNEVH